jgi:hypothetical protein
MGGLDQQELAWRLKEMPNASVQVALRVTLAKDLSLGGHAVPRAAPSVTDQH